jgi:hypothetical protein
VIDPDTLARTSTTISAQQDVVTPGQDQVTVLTSPDVYTIPAKTFNEDLIGLRTSSPRIGQSKNPKDKINVIPVRDYKIPVRVNNYSYPEIVSPPEKTFVEPELSSPGFQPVHEGAGPMWLGDGVVFVNTIDVVYRSQKFPGSEIGLITNVGTDPTDGIIHVTLPRDRDVLLDQGSKGKRPRRKIIGNGPAA